MEEILTKESEEIYENESSEQENPELPDEDENDEEEDSEADNEIENLKKDVKERENELAKKESILEKQSETDFSDKVFDEDLQIIKKAFPFVEAGHVRELGEKFLSLMAAGASNGLSAVDAYAATHREEIFENLQKTARQEALTKLESKAHMKPVLGIGGATTEVPRSVYEKYKRLIPNITDAEIRRHYNASKYD